MAITVTNNGIVELTRQLRRIHALVKLTGFDPEVSEYLKKYGCCDVALYIVVEVATLALASLIRPTVCVVIGPAVCVFLDPLAWPVIVFFAVLVLWLILGRFFTSHYLIESVVMSISSRL